MLHEQGAEGLALQSAMCEMELLGAIFQNPESIALIDLGPEHFRENLHQRIFHAMQLVAGQGRPPTLRIIASYFAHDEAMSEIGGLGFLDRLKGDAAIPMMVPKLVSMIRDFAKKRDASVIYRDAITQCSRDDDLSAEAIISDTNRQIMEMAGESFEINVTPATKAFDEAISAANSVYRGEKDESRIPLGMAKLEKLTGGIRRGNLGLAGGRPGMGKTAFGISLASAAAALGVRTLVFSLEMSSIEFGTRLASSAVYKLGAVEYTRMRAGPVTDKEIIRMIDAKEEGKSLPLWLDCRSGLNISQIQAAVAFFKLKYKIDLAIVDYLGLIRPMENYRNKVDELGEISGGLKTMAGINNVAVVALHQLSRAVEHRDNKRPGLADLRDSGNLEQDADMVWFPFREAYYLLSELEACDDSRRIEINDRMLEVRNMIEVIVAKNRHGQCGSVRMYCDIASNVIADQKPNISQGLL